MASAVKLANCLVVFIYLVGTYIQQVEGVASDVTPANSIAVFVDLVGIFSWLGVASAVILANSFAVL